MADLEKLGKWGADNLTGLLAVIAGLILLGITYKIILNILLFSVGIVLLYFGLVKLRVRPIVNAIDRLVKKFKSTLST
ncbi:hypothetical protein GF385_02315 [Candidatus Dependentiae bacterium]|nr:hypothetical protein [Candidatus Dependentiae bacterium]